MTQRSVMARLLASVAIAALPAAWIPTPAEPLAAGLTGVIRGADRTPLAGARLLAAHTAKGRVYRSAPSSNEGSFTLSELEPGSYALAVETDGGVYLVRDSLPLVAGVQRTVQISVGAEPFSDGESPVAGHASAGQAANIWNNPLSAGALVLGIAIVVGVLINNATDDELASTPVN
jgi:hypothetical protein